MKHNYKIIIAIICLLAGLAYQFYFEPSIVIIDKETTDFLSGMLFGFGISLIVVSIFNPKKKRL